MPKLVDITGARFGRWIVLSRAPVLSFKTSTKAVMWFVRCDCGAERIVNGGTLRSHRSNSCGCWKQEVAKQNAANGKLRPRAQHARDAYVAIVRAKARRALGSGKKRCLGACALDLPLTAFHRRKDRLDGLESVCKPCRVLAIRRNKLKSAYGITPETLIELKNKQQNACAICKSSFGAMAPKQIHIDHDHATGRVRGVLCHACNLALGLIRDSITTAEALASYLRRDLVPMTDPLGALSSLRS